jgi:hypothetical protein
MDIVRIEMFSQKRIVGYWPLGVVCSALQIQNQNVHPSALLHHFFSGMYGVCVCACMHLLVRVYVQCVFVYIESISFELNKNSWQFCIL